MSAQLCIEKLPSIVFSENDKKIEIEVSFKQ